MKQLLMPMLGAMLCATPLSASPCNEALAALQQSYGGTVANLQAALDTFRSEADCNAATARAALSQVSGVLAGKAQALVAAGALDEAEAVLGTAPALHWAVQAVRGDLAARRGARSEAAQLYNAALDTITDPSLTPPDPRLAPAAERITRLAQENMMLAGSLSTTLTRGGTASGLMKSALRGISIEAVGTQPAKSASYEAPPPAATPDPATQAYVAPQPVPSVAKTDPYAGQAKETYVVADAAAKAIPTVFLPIRFASGSAQLDSAGLYEAEAVASFLKTNGLHKITLVGHTDDVGPEAFNLNLSLERARTVRDFLIRQGVQAEIWVDGKGESAPPRLTDPTAYSLEERRAIARRVELVLHG